MSTESLTRRSHSTRPGRMSTSSNGKGGGKQFFKKKMPKKHPPQKQKTYEVTFKQPKTVLSGATPGEECGNVSNPVLSGKVPDNRRYI